MPQNKKLNTLHYKIAPLSNQIEGLNQFPYTLLKKLIFKKITNYKYIKYLYTSSTIQSTVLATFTLRMVLR